ncbi:MAG: dipeptidase [Thermoplasmatota archaeon]
MVILSAASSVTPPQRSCDALAFARLTTMPTSDAVLSHARENRAKHLEELKELLRVESVSAQPVHKKDIEAAALWVADKMRDAGLQNVKLMPTGTTEKPGNPVVYGDWLHAGTSKPTILVYGHYDVQPGEPFNLWTSPAFQPTVRDGKLYARGATDDKGQMYTHIKGVQAHLATAGTLPVNVKFIIEGEEEVGSENLDAYIEANKKLLACDVALVSDTAMWDEEHPCLTYSLRGLVYYQVDVKGPNSDLHSGTFGGAVPNAAEWVAKFVAASKDAKTGTVLIPGFYKSVRKLTPAERKALTKLPHNDKQYAKELGLPAGGLYGEKGYTTIERTSVRPTFEVNGIYGGYEGAGAKTVLPNEAHAKLSMRLVADQDPAKIGKLFEAWIKKFAWPKGLSVKATNLSGGWGAKVPIDHPAMKAGVRALEGAFPGKKVVFAAEGGSIPVIATFQNVLKAPTVLMGFGLHDENLHAPNEHIRVENFYRGIEASARFFDEVATSSK